MSYVCLKSPITADWAFLCIFHVPRLLLDQCSTALISLGEQSDQPYGLKDKFRHFIMAASGGGDTQSHLHHLRSIASQGAGESNTSLGIT